MKLKLNNFYTNKQTLSFYKEMLEILFRKILTKTEGISLLKNNSLLKKQLKFFCKRRLQPSSKP